MKEKVLILGGTEFVGRLLVEALRMDKSKAIYLFNRGKTNSDLFPELPRIIGDRETDDIEKIKAYQWDYVVDFSSFYPKSLQKTVEQINRNVKKYIYISTISVYDLGNYDGSFSILEDYEKVSCSAAEAVDQSMKTYGKKKMACEAVLNQADWLPSIILRPSVIYGKYDPTDRFYYWLRKIKLGNEIVIPNDGEDQLTLTYANDLVAILLQAINTDFPTGSYNCSTHQPISFNALLEMMKDLLKRENDFYGMAPAKLRADKIWLPLSFVGNFLTDNTKVKKNTGLDFTLFKDSIADTIAFYESENWPTCRVGMTEALEEATIRKDRTARKQ